LRNVALFVFHQGNFLRWLRCFHLIETVILLIGNGLVLISSFIMC